MITARILADSINPIGVRLVSILCTYNRFIHSEVLTHRSLSRNSASSRAIPFAKMVEYISSDPALPERWGSEQKGMASGEPLSGLNLLQAKQFVLSLKERAIDAAIELASLSLHKSIVNRYLEPWAHITTLYTGTDKGWRNFFALRAHPDAMPEFQVLAYRMLNKYLKSEPDELQWREWHVPNFLGMGNCHVKDAGVTLMDYIKIATARCARLSYLTHDKEQSAEVDIKLYDRLLANKHLSPFEHCAMAEETAEAGRSGNFDVGYEIGGCGWSQYRKMIPGEMQGEVNLEDIMATKPDWIAL